ncbi:hypothetical protein [Flavobacterium aquidurense]|uniref:Uncharacterized protein n=1 Tax=Flavobacterium aquidurense TaxID=362413 RepID=A0A0Q0WX30_9FLAO|nr:hypothetical protein [Flavobacterium aquidurense]KQB40843.1 hypothetical protein RC62_4216 [Flavobacterium aquidurense]
MKFFIFKYSIAIISCIYLAYFFYNPNHSGNMIKMGTSMALAFFISVSMFTQIKNGR